MEKMVFSLLFYFILGFIFNVLFSLNLMIVCLMLFLYFEYREEEKFSFTTL
jgi:hypothetical protein